MGYRAVRAQCGIPGLTGVYGVGRGELYYEPAGPGLAVEQTWDNSRYLGVVPRLFAELRDKGRL